MSRAEQLEPRRHDAAPDKPSHALLSAALCGLLASTAVGCDPNDEPADGYGDGGAPRITASRVEPDMTLARFTMDCDEAGGAVELHAHCGGVNTCRGFSYDDATLVLTEHTCRALNTCSGYSCVVPD